jgi:hypothetical protein
VRSSSSKPEKPGVRSDHFLEREGIQKMKSQIHDRALQLAKAYTTASQQLIQVLIEVDQNRSFEEHKFTYLTPYCIRFLKMDPDAAKTLVRIVRKSIDVPELAQAVIEGTIHVSNAKVIASIITPVNKDEWIRKAKDLAKGET